ncbi:MAG TPA: MFS transporter [Geobacteraceae bacterium]|nr:MFS transporter [Geobacteraceae bacterium]
MGSIRRGTRTYRQINLAFFAAGFVTFITLYDVQPLLPVFSREFGVPAALGSLPLSVATCALAGAMLLAGSLSESVGRKPVMTVSLVLTAVLAILTAFSQTFTALLGLRLMQGTVLAGLPAVAMAYLGEEIDPSCLGTAMGLYIGGTGVGGMTGRIYTATMTDYFSWRTAIGTVGVLCILPAVYFARNLPPSANFRRRPFEVRSLAASLVGHLRDSGLLCLYAVIFTVMGAFVTLFNYITFRLLAPPYNLSHTQISWIFLTYLLGSYCSTLAGTLANRYGRSTMLRLSLAVMITGVAITAAAGVADIVAGTALFTCGFFSAHSVASSWVSSRAQTTRAQATSLYLFFYYLGSSVSGTVGGLFWGAWGWEGVTGLLCLLLVCGLLLTIPLGPLANAESASHDALPPMGAALSPQEN